MGASAAQAAQRGPRLAAAPQAARRRGPGGGPARAADSGRARRRQVYLSARSWRLAVDGADRWDARLGRRRNVLPRPEVCALLPDGGVSWHDGCAPAAGVDVVVYATGARAACAKAAGLIAGLVLRAAAWPRRSAERGVALLSLW